MGRCLIRSSRRQRAPSRSMDSLRHHAEYDSSLRAKHRCRIGLSSHLRSRSGAGPRKTSSTPTTRGTSLITRWAVFRFGLQDWRACRSRTAHTSGKATFRSTHMPNAVRSAIGLSGHGQLARDYDKSPYPLTDWTGLIRIALSAFTNCCKVAISSSPQTCSLCKPTSTAKWIRNSAIALRMPSTTPRAQTDKLKKAADLMRSWDGRLTVTPPLLRS